MVDWLVSNKFVMTRGEGVEIGRAMVERGIISHVTKVHSFMDEHLFYRFWDDEPGVFKERRRVQSVDPPGKPRAGYIGDRGAMHRRRRRSSAPFFPLNDSESSAGSNVDSPRHSSQLSTASNSSQKDSPTSSWRESESSYEERSSPRTSFSNKGIQEGIFLIKINFSAKLGLDCINSLT